MIASYQKKDIAEYLSKKTGYSKSYSKEIINSLIICMKKNISSGELIIKNFGIFRTCIKKQRIGRNPRTKQEFIIKSRKSLQFKPSKKIIELINKYKWKN